MSSSFSLSPAFNMLLLRLLHLLLLLRSCACGNSTFSLKGMQNYVAVVGCLHASESGSVVKIQAFEGTERVPAIKVECVGRHPLVLVEVKRKEGDEIILFARLVKVRFMPGYYTTLVILDDWIKHEFAKQSSLIDRTQDEKLWLTWQDSSCLLGEKWNKYAKDRKIRQYVGLWHYITHVFSANWYFAKQGAIDTYFMYGKPIPREYFQADIRLAGRAMLNKEYRGLEGEPQKLAKCIQSDIQEIRMQAMTRARNYYKERRQWLTNQKLKGDFVDVPIDTKWVNHNTLALPLKQYSVQGEQQQQQAKAKNSLEKSLKLIHDSKWYEACRPSFSATPRRGNLTSTQQIRSPLQSSKCLEAEPHADWLNIDPTPNSGSFQCQRRRTNYKQQHSSEKQRFNSHHHYPANRREHINRQESSGHSAGSKQPVHRSTLDTTHQESELPRCSSRTKLSEGEALPVVDNTEKEEDGRCMRPSPQCHLMQRHARALERDFVDVPVDAKSLNHNTTALSLKQYPVKEKQQQQAKTKNSLRKSLKRIHDEVCALSAAVRRRRDPTSSLQVPFPLPSSNLLEVEPHTDWLDIDRSPNSGSLQYQQRHRSTLYATHHKESELPPYWSPTKPQQKRSHSGFGPIYVPHPPVYENPNNGLSQGIDFSTLGRNHQQQSENAQITALRRASAAGSVYSLENRQYTNVESEFGKPLLVNSVKFQRASHDKERVRAVDTHKERDEAKKRKRTLHREN